MAAEVKARIVLADDGVKGSGAGDIMQRAGAGAKMRKRFSTAKALGQTALTVVAGISMVAQKISDLFKEDDTTAQPQQDNGFVGPPRPPADQDRARDLARQFYEGELTTDEYIRAVYLGKKSLNEATERTDDLGQGISTMYDENGTLLTNTEDFGVSVDEFGNKISIYKDDLKGSFDKLKTAVSSYTKSINAAKKRKSYRGAISKGVTDFSGTYIDNNGLGYSSMYAKSADEVYIDRGSYNDVLKDIASKKSGGLNKNG